MRIAGDELSSPEAGMGTASASPRHSTGAFWHAPSTSMLAESDRAMAGKRFARRSNIFKTSVLDSLLPLPRLPMSAPTVNPPRTAQRGNASETPSPANATSQPIPNMGLLTGFNGNRRVPAAGERAGDDRTRRARRNEPRSRSA